jgi:hypothetical protein
LKQVVVVVVGGGVTSFPHGGGMILGRNSLMVDGDEGSETCRVPGETNHDHDAMRAHPVRR